MYELSLVSHKPFTSSFFLPSVWGESTVPSLSLSLIALHSLLPDLLQLLPCAHPCLLPTLCTSRVAIASVLNIIMAHPLFSPLLRPSFPLPCGPLQLRNEPGAVQVRCCSKVKLVLQVKWILGAYLFFRKLCIHWNVLFCRTFHQIRGYFLQCRVLRGYQDFLEKWAELGHLWVLHCIVNQPLILNCLLITFLSCSYMFRVDLSQQ